MGWFFLKSLTGRYGWTGLILATLFIGLRYGPMFLRQYEARQPASPPTFEVTPVSQVLAIDLAHRSLAPTPAATPLSPLSDREYPNEIWRLTRAYMEQFDSLMVVSEQIPTQTQSVAVFNRHVNAFFAEAADLHLAGNEIRSIHAPDRFKKYHEQVLHAVGSLDDAIYITGVGLDNEAGVSNSQLDNLTAEVREAMEILNSYPRTNAVPTPTPVTTKKGTG